MREVEFRGVGASEVDMHNSFESVRGVKEGRLLPFGMGARKSGSLSPKEMEVVNSFSQYTTISIFTTR